MCRVLYLRTLHFSLPDLNILYCTIVESNTNPFTVFWKTLPAPTSIPPPTPPPQQFPTSHPYTMSSLSPYQSSLPRSPDPQYNELADRVFRMAGCRGVVPPPPLGSEAHSPHRQGTWLGPDPRVHIDLDDADGIEQSEVARDIAASLLSTPVKQQRAGWERAQR